MDANMRTELRRTARDLGKRVNAEMLALGDVLTIIHSGQLYYHWGYTAWQDYIDEEIGVHVAATYELMSISRWMAREQIAKKQRERLAALGRCKAAIVSKMARKGTLDTYLDLAERSTIHQLRAMCSGEREADSPKVVSFWMDGVQRRELERAMKKARGMCVGEPTNGVLLAEVCTGFTGRGNGEKRISVRN